MMGKMKILLLFATVAKGTKPFLIEKPEDQIVNIGDTGKRYIIKAVSNINN
jgi:hypothetical protein